jgi:hypothetical protein
MELDGPGFSCPGSSVVADQDDRSRAAEFSDVEL